MARIALKDWRDVGDFESCFLFMICWLSGVLLPTAGVFCQTTLSLITARNNKIIFAMKSKLGFKIQILFYFSPHPFVFLLYTWADRKTANRRVTTQPEITQC